MECKICGLEFKSLGSLSKHITAKHECNTREYYDKYLITNEEKEYKHKQYINFVQGYEKLNVECKICGHYLKDNKGLTLHLKQHNLTSKEYYDKYLKKENEGYCTVCGKPTKYANINDGYKMFCSIKCSANSEMTKQKRIKTCLYKYGVESSNQAEIVKRNKKNSLQVKYGVDNVFQLNKIKEQSKETCLEKYGVEHYAKTDEFIERTQNTLKCRYNVNHPMELQNTTSKVEDNLLDWLKTLNVKVEGSKWFTNSTKRYELDIYLPEFNIGIEMDGHYYHTPAKKGKLYHLNKTNWFKEKYNIDVIHIVDLEWLDEKYRLEIENILKFRLGLEELKENRYIKDNVYDRRFFNNLDGKLLKPTVLNFNSFKYEDCGYVEVV